MAGEYSHFRDEPHDRPEDRHLPPDREVDLRPGHGRFFGVGPKGYKRSDERIREEICDRLTAHPDVDASDLEVDVSKGVVTMTGSVATRHEKRIAGLIADDALGVDDVDNRVHVRHHFWSNRQSESR